MTQHLTYHFYEPNTKSSGAILKRPDQFLAQVIKHHRNLLLLQYVLHRNKPTGGDLQSLMVEMATAEDKRDRWALRCDPHGAREAMMRVSEEFRAATR